MKASEIVLQLRNLLPQLTDSFTTNFALTSLTRSGTQMTAVCDRAHKLKVGKAVAITGAVTQLTINTLTRSGTVGTLVTDNPHDLTEPLIGDLDVTISGATESEFNDTFVVISVENRKTVTFIMADSGATTATGSPVLHNAESALRDYNATYEVEEVPNDFTFTFQQDSSTLLSPIGSPYARTRPRISAGIDPDRIADSYTRQEFEELWLYVVLGSVESSKSPYIQSDARDNIVRGAEYRQQLLQDFSLFLYTPCSEEEVGAADARDLAEDMFQPICQSLLSSKLDSGLAVGDQGCVLFLSHGVHAYNTAVYVHEYSFQQVVDLTEGDTVGPDLDVAFRDLDFSMDPDLGGTTVLDASLDLDEEPIP